MKIIIDLPEDWETQTVALSRAIMDALENRRGLPNNEYVAPEGIEGHTLAEVLIRLPNLLLTGDSGDIINVFVTDDNEILISASK